MILPRQSLACWLLAGLCGSAGSPGSHSTAAAPPAAAPGRPACPPAAGARRHQSSCAAAAPPPAPACLHDGPATHAIQSMSRATCVWHVGWICLPAVERHCTRHALRWQIIVRAPSACSCATSSLVFSSSTRFFKAARLRGTSCAEVIVEGHDIDKLKRMLDLHEHERCFAA